MTPQWHSYRPSHDGRGLSGWVPIWSRSRADAATQEELEQSPLAERLQDQCPRLPLTQFLVLDVGMSGAGVGRVRVGGVDAVRDRCPHSIPLEADLEPAEPPDRRHALPGGSRQRPFQFTLTHGTLLQIGDVETRTAHATTEAAQAETDKNSRGDRCRSTVSGAVRNGRQRGASGGQAGQLACPISGSVAVSGRSGEHR